MDLQYIKQKFGIIGGYQPLDTALDIALQVAPTDISVLVIGESGAGKEFIPKVIHSMSARKHGPYIAVNCGAIPEGTMDSELFGHEKGSFTDANEMRKGYFEVANNGTIFLDEVAELPLSSQTRLLRVLENKEFIKVGSSKVQKTDVRVVAATNVNVLKAVKEGKFREDLYYRLNAVQINIPPLRDRGNDIILLFRKFASDFAEKHNIPPIRLMDSAKHVLLNYRWPGNVRQLRNLAEQLSIVAKEREIDGNTIAMHLTDINEESHPAIVGSHNTGSDFASEREILYKILFDMKNDIAELKKQIQSLVAGSTAHMATQTDDTMYIPDNNFGTIQATINHHPIVAPIRQPQEIIRHSDIPGNNVIDTEEFVEDNLSINDTEIILIKKALEKHKGKRKAAAEELGIAERTLYRKLKQYNIEK